MNRLQSAIYPDLKDRSVFVSGGATGIGAAIVEAYAKQGAKTAFVDLDEKAGRQLAERLLKDGHCVRFDVCDITNIKDYQSKIRNAADAFGPISILLNNAANDVRHSLASLTEERFDELVGVNIKHAMFAAQTVAPMMKELGGGSIVNFGSVGWMMATAGYPTYGTSKAAMHGLTRSLARDLGAAGIRVNTLVPGWVMTEKQLRLWVDDAAEEKIKQGQCLAGKVLPEHVANMALFLGSNVAAMCSAQNFIVDGGWV
ncbi:SDR family NAD(P)-dependent oxidoreductase [Marinomonas posidonica]|uniref:3-oxoacyl-(Acyl-carrier-protein) reductase n=1 Tax=Marinomonas posidonica (strain CECT 7376 / NCIMB 14433 / IVIA-Po-181) TaxID=491952 RepID=F6CT63_MARPP|nr:SDR family oxidoreductase [Marinomonas posidonica]AEF56229.1 3-oxoacyl-(acyl-carrier-protein) reductase [Marinomonas posidonica IVIA-Po-181]